LALQVGDRLGELDHHGMRVGRLDGVKELRISVEEGKIDVGFVEIITKGNVLGGQRLAVMKLEGGSKLERPLLAVVGHGVTFRQNERVSAVEFEVEHGVVNQVKDGVRRIELRDARVQRIRAAHAADADDSRASGLGLHQDANLPCILDTGRQ